MDLGTIKPANIFRHPAFAGLSDDELARILPLGETKRYASGEVVAPYAHSVSVVFLILEGSARVMLHLKGQARELAIFRRGDYFGEFSSDALSKESTETIAVEPLTVFAINENALKTLPEKFLCSIYRGLGGLAEKRFGSLALARLNDSSRELYYANQLRRLLRARREDYSGSTVIRNIIKSVPRLPVFASRIPALLLDEKTSPREVADLAKLDPGLVGLVLKTVNSAYYGFQNRISDFNHAVVLLGFNQVHHIVMNEGIRSTMPDMHVFRELQFRSAMVSFIAFELGQLSESSSGPALATLGMLHDIGKAVLQLLRMQYSQMTLLTDLLDPAKLGALLLKDWNIPDFLCLAVEYQSFPEFLPPEEIPEPVRDNVATLYVANLCYEILQGKTVAALPTGFLPEYLSMLRMERSQITEIAHRQIYPALLKKLNSFPLEVRKFLSNENSGKI